MTRRWSIAGWTRRAHSRQGAIKVALLCLPVLYSTPLAEAVADFVSTYYDLPGSIECKLLLRGWNDTFEVRTKDGERFIFPFQSDARAVMPMLHWKPRFSLIWTGRAKRGALRVVRLDRLLDLIDRQASDVAAVCAAPAASCARATAS
jgi:hypothetical protein